MSPVSSFVKSLLIESLFAIVTSCFSYVCLLLLGSRLQIPLWKSLEVLITSHPGCICLLSLSPPKFFTSKIPLWPQSLVVPTTSTYYCHLTEEISFKHVLDTDIWHQSYDTKINSKWHTCLDMLSIFFVALFSFYHLSLSNSMMSFFIREVMIGGMIFSLPSIYGLVPISWQSLIRGVSTIRASILYWIAGCTLTPFIHIHQWFWLFSFSVGVNSLCYHNI